MACVLACVLGSQCRVCFEKLGAHEARLWLRKLKSRAHLQSRRAYPVSLTEQAKRHAPVAFEVVAEVGSIHGPQQLPRTVGRIFEPCRDREHFLRVTTKAARHCHPHERDGQSILSTMFVISATEKARIVSVRTLPSVPRLKFSAIAADSSGASTIVTTSYCPCVQTMSFTVTPNVFAISLKAPARFGDSLALRIP